MWIIICAIVILRQMPSTAGEIYFIDQPKDVNVSIGSSVRLPCKAQSDSGDNLTVVWIRNGFAISTDTMKEIGDNRYKIKGPVIQGDFDLEIHPVKRDDEGIFQCQVFDKQSNMKKSNEMKMVVMVPPKPLILIQVFPSRISNHVSVENPAWAENGTNLRLLCVAEGGKPLPKVIWTLDGQKLEVNENGRLLYGYRGKIKTDVNKDGDIHSTKSIIYLKMTNKVQNKRIRCGVNNIYPSKFVKPVFTRLQVRFKPQVRMKIEGTLSAGVFKEHDTITLRCTAKGYPDTFVWSWSKIQRGEVVPIPEVTTPWYRLQLRRELHGAVLRCTAQNFAIGHAEEKLMIQYGPYILDPSPSAYAATLGERTKLECNVDSNPKSQITWTRASYPTQIGSGPLLVLPNVDSADLGAYTCIAHVPGFPPTRKTFYLGLAGKPKIMSRSPVYGKRGKSIKLVCSIFAIPKPPRHSIRWTKHGQTLFRGDRHHIYQQDFLEGIRSVIYISHVEDSDFGNYNCSAGNNLGSSWSLISLQKESGVPLALCIGLGAAGVLVLISFILLIVFFLKRGRRQKTRKHSGYLPGESRPSDGPPSVYGCNAGSTSNDFSNKEASWLRGEARHSYFHVPSELGEMHAPAHHLALDASREATLRRIMEWRDDGSPLHPASPHASTTRGSPMHSSIHQSTHHHFMNDRGSTATQVQQQPSNSDSGISNDNFCTPTTGIMPSLARNHSPITFTSPNHPVSPVRSTGSSRSASILPSPPLPLFSGPRRHYLPPSLGDSSDDTRL